jgi:hypothetical protein
MGRPVCCELWLDNQVDGTALLPVVDRLRQRIGLKKAYWVADRCMISQKTIEGLEERKHTGNRLLLSLIGDGLSPNNTLVCDYLEQTVRNDGQEYLIKLKAVMPLDQ